MNIAMNKQRTNLNLQLLCNVVNYPFKKKFRIFVDVKYLLMKNTNIVSNNMNDNVKSAILD